MNHLPSFLLDVVRGKITMPDLVLNNALQGEKNTKLRNNPPHGQAR